MHSPETLKILSGRQQIKSALIVEKLEEQLCMFHQRYEICADTEKVDEKRRKKKIVVKKTRQPLPNERL